MIKPIILVIDDDADLRENISELLVLAGYDVVLAANGKDGLEVIWKHHPNLILCDIMMPELDGYGVLRAINNIPYMINVPFVFMTSKSDIKDLRKGMNLGVDDYLFKPFLQEDLLNVINVRLKKIEELKDMHSDMKIHNMDENSELVDIISSLSYKSKRKVIPGQIIYLEGDPVNFIYCLTKGKVKTFKTNEEGKDIITAFYYGGDIFGYASFFENLRKESCIATEESDLINIPKEHFLELLDAHNGVALKVIKSTVSHYLEEGDKMLKLAYNSSSKKIADALLFYNLKSKETEKDDFYVCRSDIAALAGVSKESVSRKLADFSHKGWIDIDPKSGNVKIKDYKKLESIEASSILQK